MARPVPEQIAENRARQCELYGAPLGDRVRRLTVGLGISQARLARTVGVSPAMLSQLVSGRRVKIGDPTVLVRLRALDHRCATLPPSPDRGTVDLGLDDQPAPLALKVEGGEPPFTWFVNGTPFGPASPGRQDRWVPDGRGFARISVTDARGTSDSVSVRLR